MLVKLDPAMKSKSNDLEPNVDWLQSNLQTSRHEGKSVDLIFRGECANLQYSENALSLQFCFCFVVFVTNVFPDWIERRRFIKQHNANAKLSLIMNFIIRLKKQSNKVVTTCKLKYARFFITSTLFCISY